MPLNNLFLLLLPIFVNYLILISYYDPDCNYTVILFNNLLFHLWASFVCYWIFILYDSENMKSSKVFEEILNERLGFYKQDGFSLHLFDPRCELVERLMVLCEVD